MSVARPVDWDQLYPNRFLKAGEFLGKKVTLTIKDVTIEELEGEKGTQAKGLISFKETPKQLALNRTNGICLKAMFGRKIPDWIGKRVTLYPSVVESGAMRGEPCIRIFGSPDIAQDFDATIQLPRKRPISMTMHKTPAKGAVAPAPASTSEPRQREPGDDGL